MNTFNFLIAVVASASAGPQHCLVYSAGVWISRISDISGLAIIYLLCHILLGTHYIVYLEHLYLFHEIKLECSKMMMLIVIIQ